MRAKTQRVFLYVEISLLLLFVTLINSLAYASLFNPGDIIVADQATGIIKVDPETGAQEIIASGGFLSAPRDVAFDKSGSLLVSVATGAGDGKIIRINPLTGQQSLVSSGGFFGNLTQLAIGADGSIFVTVFDLAQVSDHTGIVHVNPITGAQTLVSTDAGYSGFTGITFSSDGRLFVTDTGLRASGAAGPPGAVIQVNPTTGDKTLITSGGFFFLPRNIIFGDGSLFVGDHDPNETIHGGAVIKVDPSTGSQTIISSGGYFDDPFGLTFDTNGHILVADADALDSGCILRVDVETGSQSVISSGGNFVDPIGITIVPEPVPLPSSLLLLGSGIFGLAGLNRRLSKRRLSRRMVYRKSAYPSKASDHPRSGLE